MRFRRFWQLTLFVVLSGVAFSQGNSAPSLVIRLPQGISPDYTVIKVDKKGSQNFWQDIKIHKGVYEYPIPFRFGNSQSTLQADQFKTLRITIFASGFRLLTTDFVPADFASPRVFEPKLEKLPWANFDSVLVNTANVPIAGQTIVLTFLSDPANCFDCILSPYEIAGTITDGNGKFHFDQPLLSEDPFFRGDRGYFVLGGVPGILSPNRFPLQPTYLGPSAVTRIIPGLLVGKIGQAFLKEHGLPNNLSKYHHWDNNEKYVELEMNGRFIQLRDDASFAAGLTPGKYTLLVHIGRGKRLDTIKIQDNILIEEDKSTTVQIP